MVGFQTLRLYHQPAFNRSEYKIAGGDFAQAIDAPSTNHHIIADGVATGAALTRLPTPSTLVFLTSWKQRAEIPIAENQYKDSPNYDRRKSSLPRVYA